MFARLVCAMVIGIQHYKGGHGGLTLQFFSWKIYHRGRLPPQAAKKLAGRRQGAFVHGVMMFGSQKTYLKSTRPAESNRSSWLGVSMADLGVPKNAWFTSWKIRKKNMDDF